MKIIVICDMMIYFYKTKQNIFRINLRDIYTYYKSALVFIYTYRQKSCMQNYIFLLPKHIFTARKRSLGQGNIFTPVCHSVHRGWSASVHAGIPHPPPPGPGPTPPSPRSRPPGTRHPPRNQAAPLGPGPPPRDQATHRSRPCPPGAKHAGKYGQRAGGTHPTGMQSCCSNVFIFGLKIFVIFVIWLWFVL